MPVRPGRYGATAQLFHWLTVVLLAGSFALGLSMVDLDLSPRKLELYAWHKWIGVTVLGGTALRLGWRLLRPPPDLPPMPAWQCRLARLGHAALYALLLAVPVAGWAMSSALGVPVVWLGLVTLPDLVAADEATGEALRRVHALLARALLVLIAVHVAAALHHALVRRDGVLARMLPRLGGRAS
ncbi:MAG: cytochrome b [Alphaproteobacteria bacterium]|nr:cytochrome b [Alphaproteobacteria bacterium]